MTPDQEKLCRRLDDAARRLEYNGDSHSADLAGDAAQEIRSLAQKLDKVHEVAGMIALRQALKAAGVHDPVFGPMVAAETINALLAGATKAEQRVVNAGIECDRLSKLLAGSLQQIIQLRAALEFYASPANYANEIRPVSCQGVDGRMEVPGSNAVCKDGGACAKAALAASPAPAQEASPAQTLGGIVAAQTRRDSHDWRLIRCNECKEHFPCFDSAFARQNCNGPRGDAYAKATPPAQNAEGK